MDNELYLSDDELAHWGIKGMRWGIRRYQNKDGSLTARGQKRYKAEMAKLKEEEKVLKNRKATKAKLDRLEAKRKANENLKKEIDGKKDDDDDASKKAAPSKKSMKDMSDAELQAAVNRARNEQAYAQLYGEQQSDNSSFTKKFVNDAIKPAAINAGRQLIQNALVKAGENLLKDKVDPNSVEGLKQAFEKLDYKTKIDKLMNPDKYLSEEDKNKRQQREFEAENQQAKREGFKDVEDRAAKTKAAQAEAARQATEAAQRAAETARKASEAAKVKAAAEEAARVETARSQAEYNSKGPQVVGKSTVQRYDRETIANIGKEDNVGIGARYARESLQSMDWEDDD